MEIDKEKLTEIMYHLQMPPKSVRLVLVGAKTMDAIHRLEVQLKLTGLLKVMYGLKQAERLATVIFNLALQYVIRNLNKNVNGILEYIYNIHAYTRILMEYE
jgi:hypothetical protein